MVTDVVRRWGYLALGTRLKRIGERLQADVQQLMDASDVPIQVSQYPILAAIDENGPSTIGKLVEALGVSQPGITRSVGQLEKKGILKTENSPEDGRQKVVSMTPLGQTIVEETNKQLWPEVSACIEELCTAEPMPLLDQLNSLEKLLDKQSLFHRIMNPKRAAEDE